MTKSRRTSPEQPRDLRQTPSTPSPQPPQRVKVAVLAGSITAAVLAAILLRIRNKHHRDLWEEQNMDTNQNTVPDTPERE